MAQKQPPIVETYLPQKAIDVLEVPNCRYRCLYGGRGSGKSTAFATYLIFKALSNIRILCCREIQNSIRDSVHRLLTDRINELGLSDYFIITQDSIKSRYGAEIIFRGLKNNVSEVKSLEGIKIAWIEEAEKVSEESWQVLVPTIREENSEIWVSFNPESEESPTYKRFVVSRRDDSAVGFLNWQDNEYFPEVLRKEMEYDRRVDYEKYLHVWEGQVKRYGQACIFGGKVRVEEFETPEGVQLYFGADWGFSVDPTVLGRMWIKENKLFIDYEFYAVGVEINELERAFDSVPGSRKWKITGDSERPDTISHMRNKGFNIVGAKKGKGSVEDGIQFLRGFEEIIIHPRCRGAVDNFNNYKWKQDKITQAILPIPAEGSDHWPDAARYALEDYIKAKIATIRWL
jgi:phage terminase large subunit